MGAKPEGVARIAFQNTNSLGLHLPLHRNEKLLSLRQFLHKAECDAIGIAEHGANLQILPGKRGIDWLAIKAALRGVPDLFALWVTKHVTGFCGTNHQLFHRGARTDDLCPHPECRASQTAESIAHVLTCPAPIRREAFKASITGLAAWLQSVETEPWLSRMILQYLWEGPSQSMQGVVEANQAYHPLLKLALAQDAIGWMNFTCGRISRSFRLYMQRHYGDKKSDRNAATWAKGLAYRLLQLAHDQWTARNNFNTEILPDGLTREEARALTDEVKLQFLEGGEDLLEEDSYLFCPSLDDLLQQTAADQRQWLVEVEAARRIAEVERQRGTEEAGMADQQEPTIAARSPPRQQMAQSTSRRRELGDTGHSRNVRRKYR